MRASHLTLSAVGLALALSGCNADPSTGELATDLFLRAKSLHHLTSACRNTSTRVIQECTDVGPVQISLSSTTGPTLLVLDGGEDHVVYIQGAWTNVDDDTRTSIQALLEAVDAHYRADGGTTPDERTTAALAQAKADFQASAKGR